MPLFENPFSLEIPIRIGALNTVFFINNNLLVNNEECASDPHSHHDFEIRYLVSGNCNQIINRKNFLLRTGQLLLIHPQEYHYQNSNNNSTQYNIRFSLIAPSPNDKAHQKCYENCLSTLMKLRQLEDDHGTLRNYLDRLMQEIFQKEEGYNESIRALCVLFFISFLRLSGETIERIFPANDYYYRGFSRAKIDHFFRKKYLSDVTIHDLAVDMKVSERQVNRYMHKMFGVSFSKKLNDMRLEKAASLLTETTLPILEVIRKSGYHNEKFFYQCFKKKFSVSPKKFREQAKAEQEM